MNGSIDTPPLVGVPSVWSSMVQIGSDWYAMKLVTFPTKGVSAVDVVDAESLRCGRDRAGGTEQLVAPRH